MWKTLKFSELNFILHLILQTDLEMNLRTSASLFRKLRNDDLPGGQKRARTESTNSLSLPNPSKKKRPRLTRDFFLLVDPHHLVDQSNQEREITAQGDAEQEAKHNNEEVTDEQSTNNPPKKKRIGALKFKPVQQKLGIEEVRQSFPGTSYISTLAPSYLFFQSNSQMKESMLPLKSQIDTLKR